jgi:DNA repair protein RecO (recombination protein O)
MAKNIHLEPAFVLHKRPYRETSLLIDLFTLHYGRISLLARGVRQSGSKLSALLQPFIPLLVSYSGKTELMNLSKVEPNGHAYQLPGKQLFNGFYLNELLIKLLQQHDPHIELYQAYESALSELASSNGNEVQLALRIFEKRLLKEIGYELRLDKDVDGRSLIADANYIFKFGIGLLKLPDAFVGIDSQYAKSVFAGSNLLALHNEQLSSPDALHAAQNLLQMALQRVAPNLRLKTQEFR